mmetsp:Transcript_62291/g.184304  ORF Transcript_62291/g.184304 Transcript_62291/m.184304 type:complete len:265 (-) Transcript_62291:233-1027(-)
MLHFKPVGLNISNDILPKVYMGSPVSFLPRHSGKFRGDNMTQFPSSNSVCSLASTSEHLYSDWSTSSAARKSAFCSGCTCDLFSNEAKRTDFADCILSGGVMGDEGRTEILGSPPPSCRSNSGHFPCRTFPLGRASTIKVADAGACACSKGGRYEISTVWSRPFVRMLQRRSMICSPIFQLRLLSNELNEQSSPSSSLMKLTVKNFRMAEPVEPVVWPEAVEGASDGLFSIVDSLDFLFLPATCVLGLVSSGSGSYSVRMHACG